MKLTTKMATQHVYTILPPDWVLWEKRGGLLGSTKQEVGRFQNKDSKCFQKVSEWQMVDQGKANA